MYYARMRRTIILLLLLIPAVALAQRDPVLKQIDLPHSYYYREMYLPQLTTGPSAVCWSPDGAALVYSMQGSLWKQAPDTTMAEQLTAGPGYDYQPDWSPDGRWIAFARYYKDAVDLYLLDPASRKEVQVTSGGDVNLEPRWSPDGKRLAFVSTRGTGHLHIFIVEIENGAPGTLRQLTQERRSSINRYYYSPFDHEISPTWSPDGSEIVFVSNPERYYGTGAFFRMKAEPGAQPAEIHNEETTWKARPDWSRDGKRIVFSSYEGRQWNQIRVMTAAGTDPFQLTYGEYDNTAPRWSPDGKHIAFISNRGGNTSLWIQDWYGGKERQVRVTERRYLHPTATLAITVTGPDGKPAPARVSVNGQDARAYAPDDAWMRADDSFDRSIRPFEVHYFHTTGSSTLTVPAGKATVEVLHGFEYVPVKQEVELKAGERREIHIALTPLSLPASFGRWISGDVHVHMNYGGNYRNTPKHMIEQAQAENLGVVHNLIVNKEQRIPDIAYFSAKPDAASTANTLLLHEQEFHTSYWGHLGLLHLMDHFLIPDYVGYTNTAAASIYPTNAAVADLAHAQGALVGYVHPFDSDPDPVKDEHMTNELPVDVALGKVDYYEVVGFSDHKATAHVWYRLLNCGFRLPAAGGTDAMSNYASLRGPVGLNRTYVKMDGPLTADTWIDGLRKGHTYASNSATLGFRVQNAIPGDELQLPAGKHELRFSASMRSIASMDHFEIVFNGKVLRALDLSGNRTAADADGSVTLEESGWLVLRAWNEKAADPVLDIYPYASTSPIYVTVDHKPVRSAEDAAYFRAWIDRLIDAAAKHTGYNTDEEKAETLRTLKAARAKFE